MSSGLTRRQFLSVTASGMAGVVVGPTIFSTQPALALSGADFYATLDLDRPELSEVASKVSAGDFAGADNALQVFYAARETPSYLTLEGNVDAIPTALDIADGHFEFEGGLVRDYYDSENDRIDVDWDDPWDEYENPPVNAPSLMNRFTFNTDLVEAYLALPADDSRRDTLAAAWMQLATDFIADKGDVPIGDPPHNRLTEGIRLRFWLDAFAVFRDSTAVSAADLVSYVDYMRQSARDIQRNVESHKGNNWYVSLSRSVYFTGLYVPEFKDAPTWRFKGMSAADRYVDRNVRSDGLSYEPAINYQNYSLSLTSSMQELGARNDDMALTEEELSFVLIQAEAVAAVTMPNFAVPLFGDTQDAELDLSGVEAFGALAERADLTWVATKGASGQKPSWGSILYPMSYAVMRSGWDEDDQYLFIGNQDTNYNASHRHPDDLGVVAYAYGRPLVVDPGAYDYSDSDSANWLRYTTEAHNTVEVGGEPQPKTTQDDPKARRALLWYSNDGFDFYAGDHEDYTPITHARSVFSPKPGCWIVSDVLSGSPGSEDYRQLWHFPADAPVAIDSAEETVTAGFGDIPGVVVVPVDPDATTTTRHSDGYLADGYGSLHSEVDYVSISQATSDTATFDTVLYPGDAGAAPAVSASRIELPVSGAVATAVQLNLPDGGTGVYYLTHEENPEARDVDGFNYNGRLFYVERNEAGDVARLSLAAGTKLVDGGTTLVTSNAYVNDLSAEYRSDTLVLSTGVPLEGDLSVNAPDVTDVMLDGESVSFTRDGDIVTIAAPQLVPGDTLLDEPFGSVRAGGIRKWSFVDNNTEHWEEVKGDWSVTRDATEAWLYSQTSRGARDAQTAVTASVEDVSVTTDVTRGATSSATHGYGVLLRYQDPGNHYKLRLYRSSGTVQAQIVAQVAGAASVVASEPVSVNLADPHDLRGTVHGDRLSFAVDGSVVVTATDDRIATGGIGLWAHQTEASFGDVSLDARKVWDFDDGQSGGWRGLQGSWTVDSGTYQQTDRNQNTGLAMVEQHAADVDVSVTAHRGLTGSSAHGYGVALRMHDDRTYYMARIYRTSAGTVAQLYKNVGGDRTDFTGDGVPLSLDIAKPHELRARASGDLLQFWIDGNLIATAIDDEDGTERIPTGGVGLQAHNAEVAFDDVSVAELTDPSSWSAARGVFADSSGSLRIESAGITGSQLNLAGTVFWEDYVTNATILPDGWSGSGEIGLSVRSTGDSLGYRCVLADTGDGKYARIERHAGGSRATKQPVVIAQDAVNFSKTDMLPIEVVARGALIELWLDGSLLTSATDSIIRRGGVSVIGSGIDANVSDVVVREL